MNKNVRTYGIVAVVVIALGVGAWLLFAPSESPLAGLGGAQTTEIKPTDMVHGSPSAPVTIIEYASMTCPHCAAFQKDVVPLITKDYIDTGKVKMVFREYPLDGAARMASAVARCFSGDQFFSFIDLLFANQMNWIKDFDNNQQITREDIVEGLAQMARQAGMPREKVESCAADMNNLALVDANWMEGQTRYNVNSTPTFIINGVTHSGEMPYDEVKKIIDPLLAKS
jgi:protein-disulfide isomerase